MLTIGLTGGIGAGKSTVADYFATLGVPIIDADVIARELVEPGQPALSAILQRFGTSILTIEQRLDRQQLRAHIFADAAARAWLEDLLHPRILARMAQLKAHMTSAYGILVIPLLLEKKFNALVDRVLVVDSAEALQRERVQRRDHLTTSAVDAIFATQVTRAQRLAAADDIIHNDGSYAELQQQSAQLHARYLKLAQLNT